MSRLERFVRWLLSIEVCPSCGEWQPQKGIIGGAHVEGCLRGRPAYPVRPK